MHTFHLDLTLTFPNSRTTPILQRAILKFAAHTGANSIAGRFTPGTFTNQITRAFKEPRLLVVTDPRTDHQVSVFFFARSIL